VPGKAASRVSRRGSRRALDDRFPVTSAVPLAGYASTPPTYLPGYDPLLFRRPEQTRPRSLPAPPFRTPVNDYRPENPLIVQGD
jgi:hypothetical protein